MEKYHIYFSKKVVSKSLYKGEIKFTTTFTHFNEQLKGIFTYEIIY